MNNCTNCNFFDYEFEEFCAHKDHVFSIIFRKNKKPEDYICSDYKPLKDTEVSKDE